MHPAKFLAILMLSALLLCSCRKDRFIFSGDASLRITADTVRFDTVFSTTGSVTAAFKLINTNNGKLKIDAVQLMGGGNSPFRINVDGIPGTTATDLEMAAEDSLYIFVTVTIEPGSTTLPFLVQDSIRIEYNGNTRFVQLEAYGQNARFLRNRLIQGSEVWDDQLPYVILGGLLIDSGATLTLDPGTRVFVHADAPLIVDGTLIANGEPEKRVRFAGDRLDKEYADLPASWPGIFFESSSANNRLSFTDVRHAFQAIVVDGPAAGNTVKLRMENSIVDNAYESGVFGINTRIEAVNCLISNCGNNIVLAQGGDYNFTHCTIAGYSNAYLNRREPLVYANNWDSLPGQLISRDLSVQFTNCIVWGSSGVVQQEAVASRRGAGNFNWTMDHCLLRTNTAPENITLIEVQSLDPLFDSIDVVRRFFDFRLTRNNSPAWNVGKDAGIPIDLREEHVRFRPIWDAMKIIEVHL